MEVQILNRKKLVNIPSGSGIAKTDDGYYVIGDDSPYLYFLDQNFEVISKTLISDDQNFNGKRIIKSEKADFETLELIGKNELVIFGSGGKSPQRDVFVQVFLNEQITVEKYYLTSFYNHLRSLPVLKDAELNIEATAFHEGQLYLFNRRKNIIFKFDYGQFLSFLKDEVALPTIEVHDYILPTINKVEAGFSGATILKDQPKIIFTASVEDTDNPYDDGEILGSYIGMIDISNKTISDQFEYCELSNSEEHYKVESVTIEEEISVGKTKMILITDDDEGNSMILESVLLW
ncbi:hypothetical protein [Kaistella sp.]|uniref:DUF6929 family protein n=1 Tax=Kaistella sp. TaxID=2782235 RepID=UPI00359FAC18